MKEIDSWVRCCNDSQCHYNMGNYGCAEPQNPPCREGEGEEQSVEEYVKDMVEGGFWTNEGQPIKCVHCGSTNFNSIKEYYENYFKVEYQVECQECKKILGHWAYGSWQL